MGWLGRLFDKRDTWARMVLLDLSGLGYLLFGQDQGQHPTGPQWVLAVLAFGGMLGLMRRPLISLLVQVTLLGVAFVLLDDPTINQVGASWALAELAIWA